jgi:deoxycytidylate deaminase
MEITELKSEHKFTHIIDSLKKLALSSDINYKHAAALINKNQEICYGYNKLKNPIITVHAEMDVLFTGLNKVKNIKGMDLIVIRTTKNFVLGNSRPCNHCIEKMIKIGIRKVYYSNSNGEIVCEYVKDMVKQHICSSIRYKLNNDQI